MSDAGAPHRVAAARAYDLVVVGNGAVACAIALRFADEHPDATVAVVGPRQRAGAASLAAGAMLGVFGELGEDALVSEPARAKFQAALAATAMWPAHLERLNARLVDTPPVRVQGGTYIVARSDDEADDDLDEGEAEDRDFAAVLAGLAATGTAFSEVDPRAISGLEPSPRGLPRRAVFVPGEGALATRHLHRAYDEAFARAPNVAVFDAHVRSLRPSGDPSRATTALALSTGPELGARHVVLAAGAATQALVEQVGLAARVPRLLHGVGVALILESPVALPRDVVRTPNRGLLSGLYSVPYPAPFAYLGATSSFRLTVEPHADASATAIATAQLLGAAAHHLHRGLPAARLHKTLVGSRPTSLDTYPLLGQTSIPGLWLATGTKRDGLHLSPKLADDLVRALDASASGSASASAPLDDRFAPERPLLLPRALRAASIERAAALRLRGNRARARRSPVALPAAALDRSAQLAAVAAIYERCARAGLLASEQQIPVELLDVFDELAARSPT